MKQEGGNMEDFLREKLGHGEVNFADDWADFEPKLERAMLYRQVKVGVVASVMLIILGVGFFGGSSFNILSPSFTNKAREVLYVGTGGHSDFERIESSENKPSEVIQRTEEETAKPELATETSEKSVVSIKELPESNEEVAQNNAEEVAVAANAVDGDPLAEVSGESSAGNATEVIPQPTILALHEVQSEVDIPQEMGEPLGDENIVSNEKMAVKPEMASAGLSLVPDGKSGSNYKPNVKPTELMFDFRDVKKMELRTPIVSPPLRPAKSREPYVSPLQEKRPWSFSLKVYPNFTYRKFVVAPNKMTYIHRDFVDQVKASEKGGLSLNIGLEASKRIGKITYVNLGVEFISYKTKADFDFINYRDAVINSASGEIRSYHMRESAEHIVIFDDNKYNYLNFPLSIAYRPWASENVRINIEGGASYMHFVSASGQSLDYQTLEIIDISERDYRSSMGSIFMKIGATYHVSSQFSLGFEPTMVYFTNTIYTEKYPFEVIPYSVGLNFKLLMKLN